LTIADELALLEKLKESAWLHLDEMAKWLQVKRGVKVSSSTVY
jgi:hypothetical protein